MAEYPEELVRYVLADCSETGETKCFARLPPEAEIYKDPMNRRKKKVRWYSRHSLRGRGCNQYNWGVLEVSPFWINPRLVTREEIPEGVQIL
jgi:hypothetical protein